MLGEIVWSPQNLTIVLIFSVPIISVVLSFWCKVEQTRSENGLKRSMIERGMSVEEIERVIKAKAK